MSGKKRPVSTFAKSFLKSGKRTRLTLDAFELNRPDEVNVTPADEEKSTIFRLDSHPSASASEKQINASEALFNTNGGFPTLDENDSLLGYSKPQELKSEEVNHEEGAEELKHVTASEPKVPHRNPTTCDIMSIGSKILDDDNIQTTSEAMDIYGSLLRGTLIDIRPIKTYANTLKNPQLREMCALHVGAAMHHNANLQGGGEPEFDSDRHLDRERHLSVEDVEVLEETRPHVEVLTPDGTSDCHESFTDDVSYSDSPTASVHAISTKLLPQFAPRRPQENEVSENTSGCRVPARVALDRPIAFHRAAMDAYTAEEGARSADEVEEVVQIEDNLPSTEAEDIVWDLMEEQDSYDKKRKKRSCTLHQSFHLRDMSRLAELISRSEIETAEITNTMLRFGSVKGFVLGHTTEEPRLLPGISYGKLLRHLRAAKNPLFGHSLRWAANRVYGKLWLGFLEIVVYASLTSKDDLAHCTYTVSTRKTSTKYVDFNSQLTGLAEFILHLLGVADFDEGTRGYWTKSVECALFSVILSLRRKYNEHLVNRSVPKKTVAEFTENFESVFGKDMSIFEIDPPVEPIGIKDDDEKADQTELNLWNGTQIKEEVDP